MEAQKPEIEWDLQAEKFILAEGCRRSLWTFVKVGFGMGLWPLKKGEQPVLTPRLHRPMCEWFQKYAMEWVNNRQRMNVMMIVPRFFAKTTLITKAAQIWLHLHDADLSTYTGSESQTQAEDFVISISKIIDGSDPHARFTWLFGNWCNKNREWRRLGLVHAARRSVARTEYSFGTWSVEKGVTGRHPDAGFFDDPISYESMQSHANWFQIVNDHVSSIMPAFADNCLMVFVGTRYGDGDHLGTELQNEYAATWDGMECPYTAKDGKSVVREGGKWHCYFLAARDREGKPTFPERCGEKFLQEFERKHNLRYYAQMMNDPAASEYNPITLDRINQLWVDGKDVPWSLIRRVVITMDTAFKSQERQARGDDSVMQVWGLPGGNQVGDAYYLEGHGSSVWRMEDFLDKIVLLVQKYRKGGRHIILTDEPEPGGKTGTWEFAIRTTCHAKNISQPAFLQLPRGKIKKITRIVEAAGFWNDGYVKLVRDAPGVYNLIQQMVRIGNSAHDDWADAAADIFNQKVYTPTKKIDSQQVTDSPLQYVGDDTLKPKFDALKAYDDFWKPVELPPYEPV